MAKYCSSCPTLPTQAETPLRVLLVEPSTERAAVLATRLANIGHTLIATVSDGQTALQVCRNLRPQVVVAGVRLEGLTGPELARTAMAEQLAPVVLILDSTCGASTPGYWTGASACLPRCASGAMLAVTLEMAAQLFVERVRLNRECVRLANRLHQRQAVERAKGQIMERLQLREEEAYGLLRTYSMNTEVSIGSVAEAILAGILPPEVLQTNLDRSPQGV